MNPMQALQRCTRRLQRLALASLVLIACASCSTYQPPESGPVAFVTFAQASYTYEISYGGYCGSFQQIPGGAEQAVRIRAGQRASVLVLSTGGNYARCRGTVSFVPEAGAHYVGKVDGCSIAFARALPDGRVGPVPGLVLEPERNCLFGQ